MIDATRHPPRLLRPTAAAAALGLVAGAGFIIPALAYLNLPPGRPRTLGLVLAGIVAILLVRNAGRLLLRLLDTIPREWRIVLLGLYGLVAMGLTALVLLR